MICDAFCHFESGVAAGLLSRDHNLYQKLARRLVRALRENLGFQYCVNIVVKFKRISTEPQARDKAFTAF